MAGSEWGLHDALLQGIEVDWAAGELRLLVRIKVDEDQRLDRLARISITGLQYVIVDPPIYEDAVAKTLGKGLWIDDGPGNAPKREGHVPTTPEGCFAHWFFVTEWNSFIQFCGRHAEFEWLEAEPKAVRSPNLYWPGDEIPDPE